MRRTLGVCSLCALLGALAGCGSSSSPGVSDDDSGARVDSSARDSGSASDTSVPADDTSVLPTDTRPDDATVVDSAKADTGAVDAAKPDTAVFIDTSLADTRPVDTGAEATPIDVGFDAGFDGGGGEHGGTTGLGCVDDSTCDVTGDGVNACSNALFSLGTLYPTPVCIGKDCDPGDGTTIETCDGTTGVCLSTSSGGICLPACAFDDSGTAPTGCIGKDVCNVLGWGKTTATVDGVGYCFGGCVVDTDCTKGDKCQRESGLCVKTKVTYTKTLGTACTSADATAPAKCECLYLTSTARGYCSAVCKVGDASTACPTGYTCSPALPTIDTTDGSALFSTDPSGLGANCLKNCLVASDCTALNSTCKTTASGKVCYPI